jgi:cell division protein FtsW
MIDNGRDSPTCPAAMIIVATALMAIGLVMVASTSASLDRPLLTSAPWRSIPLRQLLFAAAGFVLMIGTMHLAPRLLASREGRRRTTAVFFVLVVVVLIVALVPSLAPAHRGSQRWLRFTLGGIPLGIQPSELAKLAMVALVASILSEREADPRSLRRCLIPSALAIGLCVLLVGKEDFGTAVLLACVGGAMLLVAGCRLSHLAALATLGAGALAVLLYTAPYRVARLAAYRTLWDDPQGDGYQPVQSLATIASGGWFGVGLGSGVQKYGYLPESHTDFIFASICEELGVFGAVFVILLFCGVVWLGLRAMLMARSRFERLVAFGLTATIGLQAIMNIAVVTVVTPTTGISLPFISAGGSSLLTFCLTTGALAAIATRGGAPIETERQEA